MLSLLLLVSCCESLKGSFIDASDIRLNTRGNNIVFLLFLCVSESYLPPCFLPLLPFLSLARQLLKDSLHCPPPAQRSRVRRKPLERSTRELHPYRGPAALSPSSGHLSVSHRPLLARRRRPDNLRPIAGEWGAMRRDGPV